MAALGQEYVTLADVAKNNKNGIGEVAEVMLLENPMLNDIPYFPMNEGTIHKEQIRSNLPAVYYRKANEAIPASKTTTEERTFTAAHFESKSVMDEAVASRGGTDQIGYNRWNQATGHIQAMSNEHANLTIYGSPLDSHLKVPGLMDIYSTLNPSEEVSKQIIDAGGTGSDNTSILLVMWGRQSIFGIYEKGTEAGLRRIDRSPGNSKVQIQGTTALGTTGHYWGYEENFMIDHGLVVKDYRQAARIANIDVSNLITKTNAPDLIELMILASYRIHNLNNGKGVWYVSRTVEAILHLQALDKVSGGAGLSFENFGGKQILTFLGMPIRRSDSLLLTEAAVTTA